MSSPIPVSLSGGTFTWTTAFVALLNVFVGGALVAFIRSRPSLKKINNDREANLLNERAEEMRLMRERLDRMEADAKEAAKTHAAEQRRRERERDVEQRIERHRYNNLNSAFKALLMLLKQGVALDEAVVAVEKLRAEHAEAEAKEAAILRAALISGEEIPI